MTNFLLGFWFGYVTAFFIWLFFEIKRRASYKLDGIPKDRIFFDILK